MEFLGIIFTIRDLIILVVGAISGLIATVIIISFWLKRERTLVKNLKRPIMIINSAQQDMKFEAGLLRNSGFFSIPDDPSNDLRNLDDIKKYCLLILAYSKETAVLNSAIQAARNSKIPVIVYAKHGEITSDGKDMNLIRSYYLAEIANSPLRLINLIFSILSVYKIQ